MTTTAAASETGNGNRALSVETIRREAEARLRELEPMIEEAEKLRDVLAVIEGSGGIEEAAVALRPERTPGRRPTANGANKRRILEVVADNPGITPREIALQTGIKRTVVASTVNRLKRRGELREHAGSGRRGGVSIPAPTPV